MAMLLVLAAAAAPAQTPPFELAFTVGGLPGEVGSLFARAVGDVDADGVTDFGTYAIGASNDGRVRVLSGLDRRTLHDFGQPHLHLFPRPIDGAGDVDADGFDDLLLGDSSAGTASVRSGATGAVLYPLPGASPGGQDGFGGAVARVGDVDGDGRDDLAVGTIGVVPGTPEYVRIFSSATGALVLTLDAPTPGTRFGSAVARLGDIDGDGRDEVAVAAPYDGNVFLNPGFPPFIPPFLDNDESGAVHAFSGATGALLWTARGDHADDGLAHSLAYAGDIDGDGHGDIVVGSASVSSPPFEGYARVVSGVNGRSFVEVAGGEDVDGDGVPDIATAFRSSPSARPDVLVHSGATAQLIAALEVNEALTPTAGVVVAFAGDLDRDGRADLLVATGQGILGGGETRAYVTGGLGVAHCPAAPSSLGVPAHLVASGSTSVAVNDLTLTAAPVAPTVGALFQGSAAQPVPLGGGVLCVGAPLTRLAYTASSGGVLRFVVDLTAPPVPAAAITPGSTWSFQVWFRDQSLGGGVTSNLSDATQVQFRP
jgi:hypothetical protein